MDIQDFIGKIVIEAQTKKRYIISEITSPYIAAKEEQLNSAGCHSSYIWKTINGDPISRGILTFEDATLTEPFKAAYNAYSHTQDAYYEEIGYWMCRD